MNKSSILAFGFFISALFFSQSIAGEVIHQERSLYRNILVEDQADLRCLRFNVKTSKTCIK